MLNWAKMPAKYFIIIFALGSQTLNASSQCLVKKQDAINWDAFMPNSSRIDRE